MKVEIFSLARFMMPRPLLALLSLLPTLLLPTLAHAQVYEKVFSLREAVSSGTTPRELTVGADGSFYGVTLYGGTRGFGTVFRLTRQGAITTLVNFTGISGTAKGSEPEGVLLQAGDGNFYGTTRTGGALNFGTVFKLTPGGEFTTLVEFTNNGATNKGLGPVAGLTLGNDGQLYGTTGGGGANNLGTVFRISPGGVLTTLVQFAGATNPMGQSPSGELILAGDGNFYGTTGGTVFRMTTAGALTTLSSIGSRAALALGPDGNLYGTSEIAGGNGTVFRITISPSVVLTELARFTGTNGRYPTGRLVFGSNGDLFGTTSFGGADDSGTIFKLTPGGTLTKLVDFTDADVTQHGRVLYAGLTAGIDGFLYGTASDAGPKGGGTAFRVAQDGTFTTFAAFGLLDDNQSLGAITLGGDGNFYGTTFRGGIGFGSVFRASTDGAFSTLVEFTNITGNEPGAPLTYDSTGDVFYGSTTTGGLNDRGTIFRMTPAGGLTQLVDLTDTNALYPAGDLLLTVDGSLYGTTWRGGTAGVGTVFRLTAGGVFSTLVNFSGGGTTNRGYAPLGGLVLASDGNFYGTTSGGSGITNGTIFRMPAAGAPITTLVQFTGNGTSNKGTAPESTLVQAADLNLYGTTTAGGASGFGTIFRMPLGGTLVTTLVQFTGTAGASQGATP